MRHGIKREVFICQLAANATKILQTGKGKPDIRSLQTVKQIAGLALERWVIPRAASVPDYRRWRASNLIGLYGSQAHLLRPEIQLDQGPISAFGY